MQGLFVAGTGPGAGELEVAAALRAAAGGAAATFEPSPFDPAAPPAIAARHAGNELDPASLVEAAKGAAQGADPLIAVTSGGFMAPLADRYLNRDLALELRLPIVIAAPAGPGLFNGVLLTLEAARGAGLPVAAVVISRWPEQPPRVLLDERDLLARLLPVPVVAAPADAWPVADWVGGGGAVGGGHVSLDPYVAWEQRPVADPRAAGRSEIMSAILEIAAAEGPLRASRAYALYNRASGGKKLTSVARAPLASAVYWLAQEHRLVLTRRDDIPWQEDDLIRLPDTPPVKVRELGPRTLEEVPLDEIAELIGRLRSARGITGATETKRAILSTYGLLRLTSRADEYLGLALDLAG
jgi:dethiobiotin synthetase